MEMRFVMIQIIMIYIYLTNIKCQSTLDIRFGKMNEEKELVLFNNNMLEYHCHENSFENICSGVKVISDSKQVQKLRVGHAFQYVDKHSFYYCNHFHYLPPMPIQEKIGLKIENRLVSLDTNFYSSIQPVIELLKYIALRYLSACTSVILYDDYYKMKENPFLQNLFKQYPISYIHYEINQYNQLLENKLLDGLRGKCHSYTLIVKSIKSISLIGKHSRSRVVIVAGTNKWQVLDFLSSAWSRNIVNLLIFRHIPSEETFQNKDIVLYTHHLFVDGLGSSMAQVLTAWRRGALTRAVPLFPDKMVAGFNRHRFVVALAEQPPYVVRRKHRLFSSTDPNTLWDGLEVRLLKLLAETLNFTIEFQGHQAITNMDGPASVVLTELYHGRADIGAAGVYITPRSRALATLSTGHSMDCATFLTKTSLALPRYRAIMGPFRWSVWLALLLTYLFAIFPLAFSHRHTLRHLLTNPGEIENMFWYVFGTFTNCFTFSGKESWSGTNKNATRMFIGWYWVFSIIITACYTGSIIAFVTLPVFPAVVDTPRQLLEGGYMIGALANGDWQRWYNNSNEPLVNKLLYEMEYLTDVLDGLNKVIKSYNVPYAFLGSKDLMDYTIRSNFTGSDKSRQAFHLASKCFVPFHVGLAFPRDAPYSGVMSHVVVRALQSGLVRKIKREVEWELRRSSTGTLLQASSTSSKISTKPLDRMLSLDDVQGIFLLLGAGFAIAFFILFVEIIVWLHKKLKFFFHSPISKASSCTSKEFSTQFCSHKTQSKCPESIQKSNSIFDAHNSSSESWSIVPKKSNMHNFYKSLPSLQSNKKESHKTLKQNMLSEILIRKKYAQNICDSQTNKTIAITKKERNSETRGAIGEKRAISLCSLTFYSMQCDDECNKIYE